MAHEYRRRRRIEFADTDMAGLVHFSRIFCFAEETEHAFLRSLGWSVHQQRDGYVIGFPRLATRFEFQSAVVFEDEVDIHLWVKRKGNKTLTYQFSLTKEGVGVAKGEFTVICGRCYPDARIEGMALPAELADKIEAAPFPPLEFGTGGGTGA